MEVPDKIRIAAERLKEGHRVNRITVRDFLRHFGAERRGAVKTQAIRAILDSLELETEPDFETAWMDGPIWLRLKEGVSVDRSGLDADGTPSGESDSLQGEEIVLEGTPSAVQQAEEQVESAPTSGEPESVKDAKDAEMVPLADPTFRIGRLPAANKKLVVVGQQDPLGKAIALMLRHDFSQLPVMHGEREVKGMVTWKSIGSRLGMGRKCLIVNECREDARVVDSNRTLFEAIPTIVEHGYVLVRDQRDRRITGMVTASDLSLEFQNQSEPFLLLREIELHLRHLIGNHVNAEDFDVLSSSPPPVHKPTNVADLTFGEYVRLLQHPAVWPKLNLQLDAGVLTGLLEEIRQIRNDVMHFDPDPMTPDQLGTLKKAARFMDELRELVP